jgi:glycosyltransferase involved in cell wall biosynthesis
MRAFKHSQAAQAGMLIIFIAPPGGNRKLERAAAAHRQRLSNCAHGLELGDQVVCIDYLDGNQHRHNQLNALNSAADAVLAPHSYSCDPAPLYGALACAAPGMASRAGCHIEFLDTTWPLCDWDDYRSFSRAIDRQLIDPHHRRECSAAALNRARKLIAAPTTDRLATFLTGLL